MDRVSEAFFAGFTPRSVRDRLCDQFLRLEKHFMNVSVYETRLHKLSLHAIMILPAVEEKIWCFVQGLRLQLQIETNIWFQWAVIF